MEPVGSDGWRDAGQNLRAKDTVSPSGAEAPSRARLGATEKPSSPARYREARSAAKRSRVSMAVLCGHSERRTLFGDTNATVNRRMHAAMTAALVPIVCIGETLEQRDRTETMAVLDRQIKESLDGVTGEQLGRIVLAYEPVWAIGTGRNATPAQAGEAHFHIRQRLKQWFGLEAAELCRVLYGGSVKPDNIARLIAEPDVDGALVGGASLDVKSFLAIINGATV